MTNTYEMTKAKLNELSAKTYERVSKNVNEHERDSIETQVNEKLNSFKESNANNQYLTVVKKIVFQEYQSSELNTTGQNQYQNYELLKKAIKYVIEELMELTPAQYDAIYSTKLNQDSGLQHAIRKLIDGAPTSVTRETIFSAKKTIFKLLWPEYYEKHFPKPTPMEVFDAKGDVKAGLLRAGRIKIEKSKEELVGAEILKNGKFSTKTNKKKYGVTYNHGAEVDRIVYQSMKSIFSIFELTTEELFYALAHNKFKSFGCMKIIASRGCYYSPLDFYMFNAPKEWQLEHIDQFMKIRKEANLPKIEYLNRVYAAQVALRYGYKAKQADEITDSFDCEPEHEIY